MSSAHISRFENKRILIVGDIILDEFIYTTSHKNSAEYKDVPVLQVQQKKEYLGGAANVALNIKKLKAIPYLVGTIGSDASAQTLLHLLNREEISNQYIFTNPAQKTTTKTRLFLDSRSILRLDEEETIYYDKIVYDFLLKNISDAITNHKPHALILQDYNKGVLNPFLISEVLALAKQHHLLVGVDPKFENWDLFRDVDLFKPNKQELDVMTDQLKSDKGINYAWTMEEESKLLQDRIHFKNLLVTLGSEGNFIFDGEQSTFHIPYSTLENPDVCGAGDTVIALATLALACGFSLEEVAQLSNKAGHIVCGKENVQPITFEEMLNE